MDFKGGTYDFMVIGGGVAGAVCGYELSRKGYKIMILEKNFPQAEKICGGGVSYKALKMLSGIGMDINLYFDHDVKRIKGHVLHYECKETDDKTIIYSSNKVSLGIKRNLFDTLLLRQASDKGAMIRYHEKVSNLIYKDGLYIANGYRAKQAVWASGARGVDGGMIRGQSIGISGLILAGSELQDDIFHYWYFDKNNPDEKYFWAFPVGCNLWNVGVWSRNFYKGLKDDYIKCLERYFIGDVFGNWKYVREPKAEYLGHVDQRNSSLHMEWGVGDFAGQCNPKNGGGIHRVIESAINYCADK